MNSSLGAGGTKFASWKITLHFLVVAVSMIAVWVEVLRPMPETFSEPAAGSVLPQDQSEQSDVPESVRVPLEPSLAATEANEAGIDESGLAVKRRPNAARRKKAKAKYKGNAFWGGQIGKEVAIALNAAASLFIALHNLPPRQPGSSRYGGGVSPFAIFSVPAPM